MLNNENDRYYPNEIATLLQLSNCVINQPEKLKITDSQQKTLVLAKRYPNIVSCGILLAILQKLGCNNVQNVLNNQAAKFKIKGAFCKQVNINNAKLFADTFNANFNGTINDYLALTRNSFPKINIFTTKDKLQLSASEKKEIIALVTFALSSSLAYYEPEVDYEKSNLSPLYALVSYQVATLVCKFDIKPNVIFKDLKVSSQGKKPFDLLSRALDDWLAKFKKEFNDQSLLDDYNNMFS